MPDGPSRSYASRFTSTDPTFGVRYQPIADVTLRASYATGFLPPSPSQFIPNLPVLLPAASSVFLGLIDPRRGNEFQEISPSTAAAIPISPPKNRKPFVRRDLHAALPPDTRLSADWTRIEKRGNMRFFPVTPQAIQNEVYLPGIVTREDPALGDTFGVGRIIAFNGNYFNIARSEVEALDVALDYSRDTARLEAGTPVCRPRA